VRTSERSKHAIFSLSDAFRKANYEIRRRRINKDVFDQKLKKYKEKQAEIDEEMQRHTDADESYYIAANMLLKLAQKALEIFKSSEVAER